jgi:integrase
MQSADSFNNGRCCAGRTAYPHAPSFCEGQARPEVEHALFDLKSQQHKPGTIHGYFTVLKAILNRRTELKVVRAGGFQRVRLPRYNNEIVRYLTSAQEELLREAILSKYRDIVVMALNTGLRQGELLRLTWAEVDWQTGFVTVSLTKGGKSHRVPMNSTVQGILPRARPKEESPKGGRLFPFDARAMRRTFEKAVKKTCLKPFRFPALPCKERMTEQSWH